MTLTQLAIIMSGAGILVMGYLAVIFWRDPVKGLEWSTHRAEKLPLVMIDRYIAFAILAAGAMFYGDMLVIAVLFVSFAFMAFADAYIYASSGHSYKKHLGAGVAASLVVIVALAALMQGA